MYSRILVPLDGSPLAEKALGHASDLARGTDAEIILLEAVQDSLEAVPEARVHATPDEICGAAIRGMEYLRDVAARLRRNGTRVRYAVMEGEPAAAILFFANREHVDVITMGTHGRSGISRAVLGTVAGKVAASARCPVLFVKGAGPLREEIARAA